MLQTDWMAKHKRKNTKEGYLSCTVHCLVYSLPFLLITGILPVLGIFITHFIFDKWNIIKWYMKFKNQTHNSRGYADWVPDSSAHILLLIVDNSVHLFFNFLCISVLF
jgi:hypothetical protein